MTRENRNSFFTTKTGATVRSLSGSTFKVNSLPGSIHIRCHESRIFAAASVRETKSYKYVLRLQYMQSITIIAIMLGAAFRVLRFALVLALALQYHFVFGSGDFGVYTPSRPSPTNYGITCEKIAKVISSKSQVFYPGGLCVLRICCESPVYLSFRLPGVQL